LILSPGHKHPTKLRGTKEFSINSIAQSKEALSGRAKGMILRNQPRINGRILLSEPHVLSTINYYDKHRVTRGHSIGIT